MLCKAAPTGSRRFYGVEKFRPEQVRRDETIVWKTTKLFYGGKRRKIRYKEVNEVYWQGGARRTPLRLLVVAPTPYSKRLSARCLPPAGVSTTDLASGRERCSRVAARDRRSLTNATTDTAARRIRKSSNADRKAAFAVAGWSNQPLKSIAQTWSWAPWRW